MSDGRGFQAAAVGPDFRWDAALQSWPDGAKHMGAASAPFWTGVNERDVSPAFTTDVLAVAASYQPNLLLAEYATVTAMTVVRELTGLPLAMTAWGTEPGAAGFLSHGMTTSVNRFRQGYRLAPLEDMPALGACRT